MPNLTVFNYLLQALLAKQNAHPDCMATTVKMFAVVTIIRHVMRKPENVSATKDGAVKIVPNHALKATTDWVRIV